MSFVNRGALLTFSMLCVAFTIFLIFYVYKYRQLKIFRIASPIFLCLTLVGCAVMYLEVSRGGVVVRVLYSRARDPGSIPL